VLRSVSRSPLAFFPAGVSLAPAASIPGSPPPVPAESRPVALQVVSEFSGSLVSRFESTAQRSLGPQAVPSAGQTPARKPQSAAPQAARLAQFATRTSLRKKTNYYAGTIPLTVEIEKSAGDVLLKRSGFRQELVLVDDGRHGHFTVCCGFIQAHNFSLAMHPDTFRQRNLRRQGQGELNR